MAAGEMPTVAIDLLEVVPSLLPETSSNTRTSSGIKVNLDDVPDVGSKSSIINKQSTWVTRGVTILLATVVACAAIVPPAVILTTRNTSSTTSTTIAVLVSQTMSSASTTQTT
ncbi:unnamed protein product, partial [Rotaria sordida]